MNDDETTEREKLAQTPGLPSYTQVIIRAASTPMKLARTLAGIAPVVAAATANQSAELDRQMGLAPAAAGGFDARTQTQTLGASPGASPVDATLSNAAYPRSRGE